MMMRPSGCIGGVMSHDIKVVLIWTVIVIVVNVGIMLFVKGANDDSE